MSSNLIGSRAAGVEPHDKAADLGVRSVRVITRNESSYNLVISVVDTVAGEWDPQCTPKAGDIITARDGAANWAIYTDEQNANVISLVELRGAGGIPIGYTLKNLTIESPSCNVNDNHTIKPNPVRENPGDNAHPIWVVTLVDER